MTGINTRIQVLCSIWSVPSAQAETSSHVIYSNRTHQVGKKDKVTWLLLQGETIRLPGVRFHFLLEIFIEDSEAPSLSYKDMLSLLVLQNLHLDGCYTLDDKQPLNWRSHFSISGCQISGGWFWKPESNPLTQQHQTKASSGPQSTAPVLWLQR